MATLQNTKSLSARTVEVMKPGDKDKTDTGENTGLRVACGATGVKTFFYRYTSPMTSKLVQIKIGNVRVVAQVPKQGNCKNRKRSRKKSWQSWLKSYLPWRIS